MSNALGCTVPFGLLPALKALNITRLARSRIASGSILRAEFPVPRIRMLYFYIHTILKISIAYLTDYSKFFARFYKVSA